MMIKKAILFGILSLLFLASCSQPEDSRTENENVSSDQVNGDGEEISWLYVLSGHMDTVGEGQLLVRPDQAVVSFTERPERKVRLLTIPDFIRRNWMPGSSFADDHPNATVLFTGKNTERVTVITINELRRSSDGRLIIEYDLLEGPVLQPNIHGALVIDGDSVNPMITD